MKIALAFPRLQQAFSLIPDHLHPRTFVAGGAVISDKARDIDIWILEGGDNERREIFTHLVNSMIPYEENPAWAYNVPGISKVCEIPARNGNLKYQVMLSKHPDIVTLLANFDCSVHAWAVGKDGSLIAGLTSTTPQEQVRVQSFETPHSTLRRYIMLSDRYMQPLFWPDVEELCRRVTHLAEEKAKKNAEDLTGHKF
jgi:hypothetical protein